MTDIPDEALGEEAVTRILAMLPSLDHGNDQVTGRDPIIAGLTDLAGEYLRYLVQPPPARELVTHALRLLAWHIEQHLVSADADDSQLYLALDLAGPEARDQLIPFLKVLPTDIADHVRADDISWAKLAEACRAAASQRSGGDVGDASLAVAVMQLIDLFELATETKATWSRRETGAISKDGTTQYIGGSPCARFVHAVFAEIDATMPATRIDNQIRAILRGRRIRQSTPTA